MNSFCSFKGFGDFVVACRFLRDRPRGEFRMMCGRHLEKLYAALGSPVDAQWVEIDRYNGIPAIYDVRRNSIFRSLESLLRIRTVIRRNLAPGSLLFFEYLTARERLMAWPRPCAQIGRTAPNIYQSYARYFDCPVVARDNRGGPVRRVTVFPDARLPHRVLPDTLLRSIADECERRSVTATVIRVGQSGGASSGGLKVEWIDGFEALVSAMKSGDAVISSDSLPGHVAEFLKLPVFVFTPRRKDYWMPGSTFENGGFGLFADPASFGSWLDRLHSEVAI